MPDVSKRDLSEATRRLSLAGCVAAEDEARELAATASGDASHLASLVERRTTGEPLAWITGTTTFCGCTIGIDPGVYVPRWQSEPLAERAAAVLPEHGRAIDLGTGSGALACVLHARKPRASVLGTENDPVAAACARRNGIAVKQGDLFDGVPSAWRGTVDVVVAVLPYVPTDAIAYLPRDVRTFEPIASLDGGDDGLAVISRAARAARRWLRPGGHLLLEVGGDQPDELGPMLERYGYDGLRVLSDGEGDPRGVEAVAAPAPRVSTSG
jgi:release factor glutamine methyltransferase